MINKNYIWIYSSVILYNDADKIGIINKLCKLCLKIYLSRYLRYLLICFSMVDFFIKSQL